MVDDESPFEREAARAASQLNFVQHLADWIGLDLGFVFSSKNENSLFKKELQPGSNIFDVIRTGSLDAVMYLVEHYGYGILHESDECGYTTCHWACLLGCADLLGYLLDKGVPYDTPGSVSPGARPIHWACQGGDVITVNLLLQSGVSVNVRDNEGQTPLIVAAQKGNTHLVGYLLAKGAHDSLTDNNGDGPLHWAAYKGYTEITQLLVNSGCDAHSRDNFGHSPLHLACMGGSLCTVRELCEKNYADLQVKDKKGLSPILVAQSYGHWDIASYLVNQQHSLKRKFNLGSLWRFVFGSSSNTRVPLLVFLLVPICYGYPLYFTRCIPLTWEDLNWFHLFFLMCNISVWLSMVVAHILDPGYLPQDTVEYESAVAQMADFRKWREARSPMTRLCHTCRCVRPLRAKHCRICNRCVQHFDHHCPFILNCVGLNNRVWFLIFVGSVALTCCQVLFLCLQTAWRDTWRIEYELGLLIAFLAAAVAGFMAVTVFVNALWNLTSNECLNYRRYGYLMGVDGGFHNPFSRGPVKNLEEFFHRTRVWDIADIEPSKDFLV